MIHTSKLSKGLSRIRIQFLARLVHRRAQILSNSLAASEAKDPLKVAGHLDIVRDVLHQIAGTAGTLGFGDFGSDARRIENSIIGLLKKGGEIEISPAFIQDIVNFGQTAEEMIQRR